MDKYEFLNSQLSQLESLVFLRYGDPLDVVIRDDLLSCIKATRTFVNMQKDWPVMAESPPQTEVDMRDGVGNVVYRVSQRLEWMTQQQYRERFGDEAPVQGIVRDLLERFQNHKDFDPEWLS